MSIDYHDFYIKKEPDEIHYQNLIQINRSRFDQLKKTMDLIDFCIPYPINSLIHKLDRRPKIYFDNEVHLLYFPQEKKLVEKFAKNYQEKIGYAHDADQRKNLAYFFDRTKRVFSQIIWEFGAYTIENEPKQDILIMDSDSLESFFRIYYNYHLLNRQEQIDLLPEHQPYIYQKDIIICSLVDIVSFHLVNILLASSYLNHIIGNNFAFSPDLHCLALNPETFEKVSYLLESTFFRLVRQEQLGQILDQEITNEKKVIERQKMYPEPID